MKRRIAPGIVFALLLSLAAGCAAIAEGVSLPVHVEGAVFGGNADDSIAAQADFDVRWLTEGDNTQYNKNLAAFSALLSADVYFRVKDVERGSQNRVLVDGSDAESYDQTALLREIGFDDVRYVETYKAKEYAFDTNDSATMTMAYRCADDAYDVYVFALRGCFSAQEWMSVFDPGSAEETYGERTGEHPEWSDTSRYKGAGIAAERAMEFIDAFLAEHDAPARENRILVTGHSRGGMLANMIGADMEKRGDTAFTYTFSTMPVTADTEATEYKTIFNIFDENDYYCDVLPFGNETLYRYGKDVSRDIASSDAIRAAIADIKGRDDCRNLGGEALAEYRALFGQRFPDRASLYETETIMETFATEEEALARQEELRTLIGAENGLGLTPFCSVGETEMTEDGGYTLTLEYCGGALLWGYCKELAYGTDAYAAFTSIFHGDEAACAIADFLAEHTKDITSGHLLVNGYVLSQMADAE